MVNGSEDPRAGTARPRALALAAALALVSSGLVASAPASAQEARKAAAADTATILAIDPEERLITVGGEAEPEKRRFRIDDATRISAGSEDLQLSDLAVGDRIAVTASREGATPAGPPIANEIEVVVEGPPVSAGAAPTSAAEGSSSEARGAERTVPLRDAQAREVGEARIVDSPNGILIHVDLHDLPPGLHGFHVHETGRCEPSFDAAGGHLAGGTQQHGFHEEAGPHAGDLVNLQVAQDGRVQAVVRAPALRIADLEDADGSALVIHAEADDYRSQPSGAAGDRIACGVIAPGATAAAAGGTEESR